MYRKTSFDRVTGFLKERLREKPVFDRNMGSVGNSGNEHWDDIKWTY